MTQQSSERDTSSEKLVTLIGSTLKEVLGNSGFEAVRFRIKKDHSLDVATEDVINRPAAFEEALVEFFGTGASFLLDKIVESMAQQYSIGGSRYFVSLIHTIKNASYVPMQSTGNADSFAGYITALLRDGAGEETEGQTWQEVIAEPSEG